MTDTPVTKTVRTPGRPRQDPCAKVSTWLPADDADRLLRLAHRHGVSLSAVVRRLVILRLRDTPE